MDAAGHPALLVVDTVAAAGTVEYRMDDWGIDVTVGASQKGLMMAPGLGIIAATDRALEAHKTATMPRRYWDWTVRMQAEHYRKFCGTAPQLMVFGLREALDMLFEEGLETVFERHRVLGRRDASGDRRLGPGRDAVDQRRRAARAFDRGHHDPHGRRYRTPTNSGSSAATR